MICWYWISTTCYCCLDWLKGFPKVKLPSSWAIGWWTVLPAVSSFHILGLLVVDTFDGSWSPVRFFKTLGKGWKKREQNLISHNPSGSWKDEFDEFLCSSYQPEAWVISVVKPPTFVTRLVTGLIGSRAGKEEPLMIVPGRSCWADVSGVWWSSEARLSSAFFWVNQRTGVTGTRQWTACSFIQLFSVRWDNIF